RRILAAARESHLLADHTKFGRTGLAIVSSLRAFTSVITDAHVPPNILTQLRKHVRKVLVAR
ncbi:MAG: DeoR/GlpR transcriptional regulator, partial [candidate division NC10 bacterium]|nr:DeoR/GlpR transcriptional regulator [candidate division NC10 bacterium]